MLFDTILALQEALERAAKSEFWFPTSTTSRGGYPAVNVFRRENDVLLVAELPGMRKEDLQIEVKDNWVRVAGKRTLDYGKEASVHRLERESGQFDRTVRLPFAVQADKVHAEYRDGLLALHLPQAEAEKPRKINIA